MNEREVTWPTFLKDLARGIYQTRYATEEKPDVTHTPVPRFYLLDIHEYACIPIQFSRGCPLRSPLTSGPRLRRQSPGDR